MGKSPIAAMNLRNLFLRGRAYISQTLDFSGEMTVCETLDFSGRCLGVGTRYEMLTELSRREKEAGVTPDPEIDTFMKATAMVGQETSPITDYVLKILGLDICADIMVGDDMRRRISGGQKKRVTTVRPNYKLHLNAGEMLVGPAKASFMDEISTGLEIYANSDLYRHNQELIKELSTPAPNSKDLYFPTQYSQSFLTQCKATFWKQQVILEELAVQCDQNLDDCCNWCYAWSHLLGQGNRQQDVLNLLGATFAAILFLGAGNASSVQSAVAIERTVFYRERAAGMYSELPYAFSQVAIETIYVAIQTFAYSLILYSMIGFQWQVDKFLYFYYVFMCFAYFSMYGMMVVALSPGHQIASIVMSFFLNFWNLFSGFLVQRPLIPVWWRWYYWGSPVAWTIYSVFASPIADIKTDLITSNGTRMRLDVFLKEEFGYEHDFLVPVVLAHLGWVLLFFFVSAYGIKFLNCQRR
ncbi:hypothetical protein RJ639_006555 [Escallonia herrerae]|uniref:ABC-2 type transporter transmembrane domain-containing protein n=1 Tax=Escallonia herrerae TaxID=1293975 RepID=A0AA88VVH1_9ASTE|nr:hypothetical protein RJ639_006555 [Escallonia herrerae]